MTTTTFLDTVHRNAKGKATACTRTIRDGNDLRDLSYYTICALADTMHGNPFAMRDRGEVWVVDLDADGRFLRAECLGRTIPEEAP